MVNGPTFNSKLKEIDAVNKIITIEFVDTKMPTSGVTEITSIGLDGDDGVVGWYTPYGNVYISSQKTGQKVIANANFLEMFSELRNVENIQFDNFDTSKVTDMSYMFSYAGKMATT